MFTPREGSLPQQQCLGPGILSFVSARFGMAWSLVGPYSLISAPCTSKAFALHQNAQISHFISEMQACAAGGAQPPHQLILPLTSPTGALLILWDCNLEQVEKTTLYFSSCLPGAPKCGQLAWTDLSAPGGFPLGGQERSTFWLDDRAIFFTR